MWIDKIDYVVLMYTYSIIYSNSVILTHWHFYSGIQHLPESIIYLNIVSVVNGFH